LLFYGVLTESQDYASKCTEKQTYGEYMGNEIDYSPPQTASWHPIPKEVTDESTPVDFADHRIDAVHGILKGQSKELTIAADPVFTQSPVYLLLSLIAIRDLCLVGNDKLGCYTC
jgi:hypothetical protein